MIALVQEKLAEQWRLLVEEWTPKEPPDSRAIAKVMGLYLIVALVLFANRYIYRDLWDLFGPELTPGPDKNLLRKVWWAGFISFCYAVPPYIYARKVLDLRLADLGVTREGFIKHAWIYGFGLACVLPLVFIVAGDPEFLKSYPLYPDAGRSWEHLLIWETVYAIQFVTLEFFFRGFMLFGSVRVLGLGAIPAMVVPYMMIHFPKPELECFASIIAGFALGAIALRTRAIFAGMLIHITVAWTMDAMALWHEGSWTKLLGGP